MPRAGLPTIKVRDEYEAIVIEVPACTKDAWDSVVRSYEGDGWRLVMCNGEPTGHDSLLDWLATFRKPK